MKKIKTLKQLIARVPAKLIISGEHAVVYGKPALAMAVNRYVDTAIAVTDSDKFSFDFLNLNAQVNFSLAALTKLFHELEMRYQQVAAGICKISEVLRKPAELLEYALIYMLEQLQLFKSNSVKIEVNSNIPVGCGMGSSAAAILSLVHAISKINAIELTAEQYLFHGREIERLQHGYSSGLDLFLSIHGGCHLFAQGKSQPRVLPKIPFILINTGKPQSITGECLQKAAEYFKSDSLLADEFAEVTLVMDLALTQNNFAAVRESMRENHRLLQYLQVVPKKVSKFIAEIEARGGAAKISGAGSIHGDNAGIVLVDSVEPITDLVQKYGYEAMDIYGETHGLQII